MEDKGPPGPAGTSSRLPLFVFWSTKSFLLKWREVPAGFLLSGTLHCLSIGILLGVPAFLHFCSSSWYLENRFTCLNHDNSYILPLLWHSNNKMPWGADVPNPSAAFVLHAMYASLNSLVLTAIFYCFLWNTPHLKDKNYEKLITGRWETS